MTFEQMLPPLEPAAEPAPPRGRAPWGYADIAMAIGFVIGAIVVIAIPAVAALSIITDSRSDDDETVTAISLATSFLLEGVLLVAAALFSVGKYKLSWAALGLR